MNRRSQNADIVGLEVTTVDILRTPVLSVKVSTAETLDKHSTAVSFKMTLVISVCLTLTSLCVSC